MSIYNLRPRFCQRQQSRRANKTFCGAFSKATPRRAAGGTSAGGTNGFTLLEVVIVIVLTAVLMALLFQALSQVHSNEEAYIRHRDREKEVYLLYNALRPLFRTASATPIFNNRTLTPYFQGTGERAIFLSRSPLIFPYGCLSFVELRFHKNQILYREKRFYQTKETIDFSELEDTDYLPLLEEVDQIDFLYYFWDQRSLKFDWKRTVDTFDRDALPLTVSLAIRFKGRLYEFLFPIITNDSREGLAPTALRGPLRGERQGRLPLDPRIARLWVACEA